MVTSRTFTGGKRRPVRGLRARPRPPRPSRRSPRRRAPSRRSRPRTATARGRRRARAAPGGTRRNGRRVRRLRLSQLVTGTSEKKRPNIVPARATSSVPESAEPGCQPLGRALEPFPDAGLGDRAQRLDPRRHRQRIPGERPRLVHGADRGDELHDLAPSAVGADGQPAPDDLAERGQVGRHPVQRLRASRVDAEPGHHLVEDEESTVRRRQLAEACEEAGLREDETHVAGDGLHDHRRDVRVRLEEPRVRRRRRCTGPRACRAPRPA